MHNKTLYIKKRYKPLLSFCYFSKFIQSTQEISFLVLFLPDITGDYMATYNLFDKIYTTTDFIYV